MAIMKEILGIAISSNEKSKRIINTRIKKDSLDNSKADLFVKKAFHEHIYINILKSNVSLDDKRLDNSEAKVILKKAFSNKNLQSITKHINTLQEFNKLFP